MTRSDPGAVAPRATQRRPAAIDFALFATGAPFSCEVLRALRRRGCQPRRIVLPFYPPAPRQSRNLELSPVASRGEFIDLAGDCALDYAPAAEQEQFAAHFATRRIDFILVACWPYLIGAALLGAARKAALNLHPSLLPAYRGADPLGAQLAAGDENFGVTLHLLDARFDHGDIVAQNRIESAAERTTLERRCAERGAGLFVEAAARFDDGWTLRRQIA